MECLGQPLATRRLACPSAYLCASVAETSVQKACLSGAQKDSDSRADPQFSTNSGVCFWITIWLSVKGFPLKLPFPTIHRGIRSFALYHYPSFFTLKLWSPQIQHAKILMI